MNSEQDLSINETTVLQPPPQSTNDIVPPHPQTVPQQSTNDIVPQTVPQPPPQSTSDIVPPHPQSQVSPNDSMMSVVSIPIVN